MSRCDQILKALDGAELGQGLFSLATVMIGLALSHGYSKEMVMGAMSIQWDRQAQHFDEFEEKAVTLN